LLNLNAFDWLLLLQTSTWENFEPCEECLLEKIVASKAQLFDQCRNLCNFAQKEWETRAMYCKTMAHESGAKYFANCNTIGSFSELLKIAVLLRGFGQNANVLSIFFPWCCHNDLKIELSC